MGLGVSVTFSARNLMRMMTWYELLQESDKSNETLPEDSDLYTKLKVVREQLSEEEEEEGLEEEIDKKLE